MWQIYSVGKIISLVSIYKMAPLKVVKKVYNKKKVPANVKKYVKRELDRNIENKRFWTNLDTAIVGPIGQAWEEYSLAHQINIGATTDERVGRQIKITGLYIKGILLPNADTLSSTIFRVVIGRYRCSGVNAGDDAIPLGLSTASIDDPINNKIDSLALLEKKYYDKYIIAYHPDINLAGAAFVPKPIKFKYFKRFKNPINVNYSGDKDHAGAGTNRPNRTIVLSIISTDGVGVAGPAFANGFISMSYEDA